MVHNMADKAHLETDRKLEEMGKHLSAIYARAEKELQKKTKAFAETIDEKSIELLEAVKSAKTASEKRAARAAYIRFYGEIIKSEPFAAIAVELADDLYRTNKNASLYINSQTPHIYAENYNFINRSLANDISGFPAQQITDRDAGEYGELTRQNVDEQKDKDWNRQNFKKSVATGALLLLGAYEIMRRATKSTIKKNYNAAKTQSNGMGTDAETKARLDGMQRAADIGNDITKIWVATLDNRTRDSHAALDSTEIQLDETFWNGCERPRDPKGALEEICNCRCTLKYGVGQAMGKIRAARHGHVSGSYKNPASFAGTYSIEVANMTYKEWMQWRGR